MVAVPNNFAANLFTANQGETFTFFIILFGIYFCILDAIVYYRVHVQRICDADPSSFQACQLGWVSFWHAYFWIQRQAYATACWTRHRARHRAAVLDRGRAILKPGIAPKAFVPIRYDPDGSTTVPVRNPRRANAKELRRAYDRAREELQTLEREAQPKKRKIN